MKPLIPNEQHRTRRIKARKQIAIPCGTFSTPLVLQRSGIGDPEKLKQVGVEPKVYLPGVGLNSQIVVLPSLSIVPSLAPEVTMITQVN